MSVIPHRLPPPAQDRDNWCWAAVADYIAFSLSSAPGQCVIANACLPHVCGGGCSNQACDVPHRLEHSLSCAGHPAQHVPGALSEQVVVAELDAERPLGVRIAWRNTTLGHFLTIVGYVFDDKGGRKYVVYDPAPPGTIEYLSHYYLATNYKSQGTWTDSYLLT